MFKVAIVHDWLSDFGGAEVVLKNLLNVFPDADLYTIVDFFSDDDRKKIGGKYAKTTFIQKLPFAKKYFRHYFFLFPYAIESLDLRQYDLILSSSHAFAKGVLRHQDQVHICYCHTPMRYAWDMYYEYMEDFANKSWMKRFFLGWILHKIRLWDFISSQRVDYFIANSSYIQKRIYKVYKRDSVIIQPPVDIRYWGIGNEKEPFYITASRLVPYKKTRLIVEAFNENGKKLVVIGTGSELSEIKAIAKSNVLVLGYQNRDTLRQYMQKAVAFVYAGLEDFGIIMLEAQACGTPVICYGKGGVLDSVIDGKTGLFFFEQTLTSLNLAVQKFEEHSCFDPKELHDQASLFSEDVFQQKIDNYVMEVMK